MFFVLGYIYAQDRGWQLEFTRRIITGTLSDLAPSGSAGAEARNQFYKTDVLLRQIGLRRAGEFLVNRLSQMEKQYLQQYVRGINYYIDSNPHEQPLELRLLNFFTADRLKMGKWTLADALAIPGFMAMELSFGATLLEIFRRDAVEKLGANLTEFLLPILNVNARSWFLNLTSDDVSRPSYLSFEEKNNAKKGSKLVPTLFSELFPLSPSKGSNNWVIGPNKTESGKPILANDMHLSLTTPGIWYEVHLSSPDFHAWGWVLPGMPLIVAGHNEYVQWGFTNNRADVADLYYVNQTEDGTRYYVNGETKPFKIITENVRLSNGTVRTFEIKISEFGPLIKLGDEEFAFQWPLESDDERNNMFRAFWQMNKATSAQEFKNALRYFSLPGQNVVFADVQGNYGYQLTGLIPIRNKGYGLIPSDSSSGEYYWKGYIPFEELYGEMNPEKGYFATANNKVVPDDYPYYIGGRYTPAYRAERISELIESKTKLSIQDVMEIQQDVYFKPTKQLLKYFDLIDPQELTEQAKQVFELAKTFDGYAFASSSEAAAFFAWEIFFEKEVFYDELGEDLFYDFVAWYYKKNLADLAETPSHLLFDKVTTPQRENAADLVVASLEAATQFLNEKLGNNPQLWRWGALHKAYFPHTLGRAFGFFNPSPVESNGAMHTINVGHAPLWAEIRGEKKMVFQQTMGSSERVIAEVSRGFSKVFVVTPPGQIGTVPSSHYQDQLLAWASGRYFTTVFDPRTVVASLPLSQTFTP